jgi:hypothetical protein
VQHRVEQFCFIKVRLGVQNVPRMCGRHVTR